MKSILKLLFYVPLLLVISCNLNSGNHESANVDSTSTGHYEVENGWSEADDLSFLKKAYGRNETLTRINERAIDNATTPAVKNFAQQSVQYFENLNKEIKVLEKKFISLNETGSSTPLENIDMVMSPGADFEQAYLKIFGDEMDHQFKDFQEASEKAFETNLRNWAGKIVSNLQSHLTAIEELKDDL